MRKNSECPKAREAVAFRGDEAVEVVALDQGPAAREREFPFVIHRLVLPTAS